MNLIAKYKIAAVICSYNRDKHIINALKSLVRQTIPVSDFQVIFIDNNSSDNTATLVKTFIEQNRSLNISYYLETTPGLSAARNRGFKESEAYIVAYMDDDAIAFPGWLQSYIEVFKNNAAGAGGKVIPLYENGEPEWMNKYLNGYAGKVDHGQPQRRFDEKMKYPSGCNMAWRKDILQQVGGFNTNLHFRSDDKYIFFEVAKVSKEIWWVPDAIVNHIVDEERLRFENFKKLYLKTGNEEKIRLNGSFSKLFEYTIKLIASLLIYVSFTIKGQSKKGKYIFLSQYYTWRGFLMKDVFVR